MTSLNSQHAPFVLVPLDGSPLAEGALGEAARLAKALGAAVILLQVIPPPPEIIRSGTLTISVDEIWASQRTDALRYLNGLRAREEFHGVATETAVEPGDAAGVILDVARARDVSHIVMTTHGRTGLTRWVLGSVAEKVMHAADRTVVLVRAGVSRAAA